MGAQLSIPLKPLYITALSYRGVYGEPKIVSLGIQSREFSPRLMKFLSLRARLKFCTDKKKTFVHIPLNALKTINLYVHKQLLRIEKRIVHSVRKKLRSQRKSSTTEKEAPSIVKPMHYARLRDPGTKERFSLLPKSRKQS